jgi:oligogalacturonide transporter
MLNLQNHEVLQWWRKIGYGLGDIYGGGSGVLVSFYYLIFLTDVIQIRPALAGTVILISKIYDAITDPFEGIIADRTRTRLGRRRPYLIIGIPLIFLSFFALFYPIDFETEYARFIFVIITYLFFSTVISIVMLNYNAVQSEMSLDYNERTSLSSIRIFFSTFSSIFAALLPLEIVKIFPDIRTGYIAMGTIFGAFFALPFVITVISINERKEFQKPIDPISFSKFLKTYIAPFKMRTFVILLMMYLFTFVAMDTVSSIVVFYMKYYLLRGSEASYVSGALLISQVVGLPFYTWLSRHTNKNVGFVPGAIIWITVTLTSFLLSPNSNFIMIYLYAAAVGFGISGIIVMVYAMFPDIPDVDELISNQRREGSYAAIVTFMRKTSSAFALFLVSSALDFSGYVKPVEEINSGITRIIEQPQTQQFIFTLRIIFALVPIILVALALFFAIRYPLTHEIHNRLNTILSSRRAGIPETGEMRKEAKELESILIGGLNG